MAGRNDSMNLWHVLGLYALMLKRCSTMELFVVSMSLCLTADGVWCLVSPCRRDFTSTVHTRTRRSKSNKALARKLTLRLFGYSPSSNKRSIPCYCRRLAFAKHHPHIFISIVEIQNIVCSNCVEQIYTTPSRTYDVLNSNASYVCLCICVCLRKSFLFCGIEIDYAPSQRYICAEWHCACKQPITHIAQTIVVDLFPITTEIKYWSYATETCICFWWVVSSVILCWNSQRSEEKMCDNLQCHSISPLVTELAVNRVPVRRTCAYTYLANGENEEQRMFIEFICCIS